MIKNKKLNVVDYSNIENQISLDLLMLNFDKGLTILLMDIYFYLMEKNGKFSKETFLHQLNEVIDLNEYSNRIDAYKDLFTNLISTQVVVINLVSKELYIVINALEV